MNGERLLGQKWANWNRHFSQFKSGFLFCKCEVPYLILPKLLAWRHWLWYRLCEVNRLVLNTHLYHLKLWIFFGFMAIKISVSTCIGFRSVWSRIILSVFWWNWITECYNNVTSTINLTWIFLEMVYNEICCYFTNSISIFGLHMTVSTDLIVFAHPS